MSGAALTALARERAEVEALARELEARGAGGRALAIVLGSGLGEVVEALEGARVIPAEELEHLPRPRVAGHAGQLVLGELSGLPVIVQSGRVHLYEGRSAHEVTRAVRAYAALGVRAVLLTNASGGLVPEWEPGTLVCLSDHLSFQGRTPLGPGEGGRVSPYDVELSGALEEAARGARIELRRGIYAAMLGPSYETPAEIRALRSFGAHAVGMSTVAEAAAAHAAGLRVVALSCIANPAAGLGVEPLRHTDVLSVMRRSAGKVRILLERAAPRWRELLR